MIQAPPFEKLLTTQTLPHSPADRQDSADVSSARQEARTADAYLDWGSFHDSLQPQRSLMLHSLAD